VLKNLSLPALLDTRAGPVTLRRAGGGDLDSLMTLMSDDPISAARGDVAAEADRPTYAAALQEIVADPANELLVVDDAVGRLVGTLQLTRIPGLARRGSTRLLVEAVRVRSETRSSGIGSALMRWVTDVAAPALDAGLVQLTSDAARTDAHRFYERLGFVGSHVGFKYRVGAERP
jgi:GNAT superfamily N-acetyltransferase